jgi:hypothetical protein
MEREKFNGEYKIAARETKYAGVLFRSRLEARWAAFFDLLGWDWEYEPIDLDGWTPDFRLFGRVLVEVKPVDHFDESVYAKVKKHAGPHGESVLLLGSGLGLPRETNESQAAIRLGWEMNEAGSDDNMYLMWEPEHKGWDYMSHIGWFDGRRFKNYTGGCYPSKVEYPNERILMLWREAGNRTMHRYGVDA